MKRIISIRAKSDDSTKRNEFIRGGDGTVKAKIIKTIESNPDGDFDFLLQDDENGKYIRSVEQLYGEVINIMDDTCIAIFTEDEGISLSYESNESLIQANSLNQLKMVRSKSRGTDIGDKISDMNKEGANIHYMRNPIDNGVDTYQSQEDDNKRFEPNWNLKRLKPFKDYAFDQTTSDKKSRSRKK